jgi:hypothetical protein
MSLRLESSPRSPSDFGRTFFWEFVQNLPLIAGFLLALDLWQQAKLLPSLACMVAGSLTGSLVIWATEARIVAGHREPQRVVVTNVAGIALMMLLLAAYLSADWSRWWTDLVFGLLGGIALGVAQDLAAGSAPSLGHAMAFALSFSLGLAGVRIVSAALPLGASVLLVTATVTALICMMDYGAPQTEGSVTRQ